MMSPGMMQGGMGQDMMGPSMGSGMMRGGMGMMCPMMAGMMQGRDSEMAHGGMGALFGSRVNADDESVGRGRAELSRLTTRSPQQ